MVLEHPTVLVGGALVVWRPTSSGSNGFVVDSPLEEAVTSELVSAQFPVIQGKYREFHWLWPQAPESGA